MHSRIGFLLGCTRRSSHSLLSAIFSYPAAHEVRTVGSHICRRALLSGGNVNLCRSQWRVFWLGERRFCGYAVEQFSDDEYECDYESHPASSSVANIDEWKWKLSLLSRSEDQEVVSRDKRDRRDYEQISNLAKRMGLYSEIYGKVVVISKVPLPNYRPDLDDKRPQREVVIPLSLQRRVEGLLQEHLDRIHLSSEKSDGMPSESLAADKVENVTMDENPDSFLDDSVMEKVLQRRSLRMRNLQRTWQESPEGHKMIGFRKSLPSFKEKERLLQAIACNQRRGRAGRVQSGECYHLYPQCVYEAFAEYQLPELLRTPLNSLCLQIKSLQVGSIAEFLSAALQPPEPLAVQNAIGFLKMIGALDEHENLTYLGKYLSVLPVDPKLGKMLVMGAIFRCFDPILTIVAGLSVRDPFLLPQDKKDLAGTAKSRFSAKDYSDHMALVRAYEGWKDAEREGSAYEYCWRNFLSAQTLQAIHSLRKQFSFILKDAGLLEADNATNNKLSHNQSFVRAVICSGLYPGITSVVHRETSMSFKTMGDGQVLLYANSVNARYQTIPYPWLVFGEKVKVNTVFIRDSTGVSDSILILFGGNLGNGATAGHLKMLDGYLEFFMDPSLAECYMNLKEQLDELVQKKLEDPGKDMHKEGKYLMLAVQELVAGDQCEGRFVFGRESKKPKESSNNDRFTKDGTNPKSLLQTLLMRAGHHPPKYKTKHLKTNEFRALVEFKGMQFVGKPKRNKALAEKDAAIEALAWLTHTSDKKGEEDDNSPPDVTDNMLKLLGKRRRSKRRSS